MHVKTTAHVPNRSTGQARSMVATGTEEEIKRWAEKWRERGWGVSINPPGGNRVDWKASVNRRQPITDFEKNLWLRA